MAPHSSASPDARLAYVEKMLASLEPAARPTRSVPTGAAAPETPTRQLLKNRLDSVERHLAAGDSVDAALTQTSDPARTEKSRRESVQLLNAVKDLQDIYDEYEEAHPPPPPLPELEPAAPSEDVAALVRVQGELTAALKQLRAERGAGAGRAAAAAKRAAAVAAAASRRSKFAACLAVQAYALGAAVARRRSQEEDGDGVALAS